MSGESCYDIYRDGEPHHLGHPVERARRYDLDAHAGRGDSRSSNRAPSAGSRRRHDPRMVNACGKSASTAADGRGAHLLSEAAYYHKHLLHNDNITA